MSARQTEAPPRWRRVLAWSLAGTGFVHAALAQVPGGPRPPSSAPPPSAARPSLATLGDAPHPAPGSVPGGPGVGPGAAPLSSSASPPARPADRVPPRPPLGPSGGANTSAAFMPGEVILAWSSDTVVDVGELTHQAKLPASAITRQALGQLGLNLLQLRFDAEPKAQAYLQWVRLNWPKVIADRNWRYEAQGAPRLYASRQVGLDCREPASLQAPGIRIGLLDTAVTPIPALRQASIDQKSFVQDALQAPTHHGTSVASALAGQLEAPRFCAPATGAQLVVAAVMSRSPAGQPHTHTGVVLPALDWVLQQRPHLLNLSLGGPGDGLLKRAITRIVAQGLPVIAAAGQPGPQAAALYPAAYPGVIAVTALDASDQVHAQAASGPHILIGAPGVDVWLPSLDGGRYESGTSFAAPVVTGTLAKAMAEGRLQARDAASWLCQHARDLGAPGRDPVHGCGALRWPASRASPSP